MVLPTVGMSSYVNECDQDNLRRQAVVVWMTTPHRLMYLNSWFPAGGQVSESLGGVALMEEDSESVKSHCKVPVALSPSCLLLEMWALSGHYSHHAYLLPCLPTMISTAMKWFFFVFLICIPWRWIIIIFSFFSIYIYWAFVCLPLEDCLFETLSQERYFMTEAFPENSIS